MPVVVAPVVLVLVVLVVVLLLLSGPEACSAVASAAVAMEAGAAVWLLSKLPRLLRRLRARWKLRRRRLGVGDVALLGREP